MNFTLHVSGCIAPMWPTKRRWVTDITLWSAYLLQRCRGVHTYMGWTTSRASDGITSASGIGRMFFAMTELFRRTWDVQKPKLELMIAEESLCIEQWWKIWTMERNKITGGLLCALFLLLCVLYWELVRGPPWSEQLIFAKPNAGGAIRPKGRPWCFTCFIWGVAFKPASFHRGRHNFITGETLGKPWGCCFSQNIFKYKRIPNSFADMTLVDWLNLVVPVMFFSVVYLDFG